MTFLETMIALRAEKTRASLLALRSFATSERNASEAHAFSRKGEFKKARRALARAERARARLEKLERDNGSDAIAWAVEHSCGIISTRRMEIAFRKVGMS